MTDDTKQESTTTEMTLAQHAMQEMDTAAAGIHALAEKYKGVVFDVTTTKGMAEAKAARAEIRAPRYAIENIRKEKGSELRKIAANINDRAANLTAEVLAIEEPIDAQIKAEEDRKAEERAERERKEHERIQVQKDGLVAIASVAGRMFGASVEELDGAIAQLQGWDMGVFDDVFRPDADKALATALESLTKARAERAALDEQAAALRAQQEELERQQEELAEQRRKDEEARAAREKADEEARAADDLARENAADLLNIPASVYGRTSEAIEKVISATELIDTSHSCFGAHRLTADANKVKALGQLKQALDAARLQEAKAEEQRAEQERLEQQRAELQRQADEASAKARAEEEARLAKAAEEQAARDAQEAQERAEREAEAIRNASLYEAASEALTLLVDAYGAENLVARKLASALAKQPQG